MGKIGNSKTILLESRKFIAFLVFYKTTLKENEKERSPLHIIIRISKRILHYHSITKFSYMISPLNFNNYLKYHCL